MSAHRITLLGLAILVGCDERLVTNNDGGAMQDLKCVGTPDLPPAKPKCLAATGLTGDNLLCVDFASPQALSDLTTAGWNFDKFDKSCWTVANSRLQINTATFATYMGTCGFLMPALSMADYGKYSSFTLSILHKVDISDAASQTIQFMLGADSPAMRLVTQWSGKQSRQQSSMALIKADLPNGGSNAFQPLFKLNAALIAGGTSQGWQIESIAVMGNMQ